MRIFSRNLEETTAMFPDLADGVRRQVTASSIIFEGEALAYDPETDDFLPFQVTVQRKRKHDIGAMQVKLPLRLVAFDLLYLDGRTARPSHCAAARAAAVRDRPGRHAAALSVHHHRRSGGDRPVLSGEGTHGLEGIMAKRLDAPYQAGARNFNWIKLKRSYQGELSDTVDCVVIGYFRGRGMRAAFGIGALLTAVYDPERPLPHGGQDRHRVLGRGMGAHAGDAGRPGAPNKPARVESLIEPDVWSSRIMSWSCRPTRSPAAPCTPVAATAGTWAMPCASRG